MDRLVDSNAASIRAIIERQDISMYPTTPEDILLWKLSQPADYADETLVSRTGGINDEIIALFAWSITLKFKCDSMVKFEASGTSRIKVSVAGVALYEVNENLITQFYNRYQAEMRNDYSADN